MECRHGFAENNTNYLVVSGTTTTNLKVQSCLTAGFPANTREQNGWTPLHSAARNGQNAIVSFLIKYGANVNAKDSTGRTPLDQARFSKKPATINLLIKSGGS